MNKVQIRGVTFGCDPEFFFTKGGKTIGAEKIIPKDGEYFSFDKVLLKAQEEKVEIGMPYVAGAKIEAKMLKQGREKKKIVFRYHSKTRYRKKKGHRQPYTEVEIVKI